ncbi:DUF4426 domain-containing protein [Corallincola spongiicola]|uniref:DUF4426 domain-containing protein n=1 Tax=Corallincola spongiicola TaxID=2520508 RepID=A0ABY1WLH8_9GAMM|nr:DUF4426 domain-containing protein [Corallincola spongiicola]TAA41770.1 DUF4426 domain-containing protein [Corallincola spongiicola]
MLRQKLYRGLGSLLLLLLAITSQSAFANVEKFGDIHVHYVAFSSTFLTPAIAKAYGITRSRTNGLVNISVLDTGKEGSPAVAVKIKGEARNLIGNQVTLKFKEIREESAVYYISPIAYSNEETFRFEIELTHDDGTVNTVKFQQKFYAD